MSEGYERAVTPLIDRLRPFVSALFGRGNPDDHRARRLTGLIQGVATNLANKALSIVISFVSLPLTIGYLGAERFGAWVVIGSALAWLGLTDFGFGHGLTNAVTTAAHRDRPDLVRMHLSNFVGLISLICLAITPVFLLVWHFVDLPAFFGVHTPSAAREVNIALLICFAMFVLRFPLAITSKVYNAYQEGRIANYWAAAGNVVSFVCLLIVVRTGGGLPGLALALTGASALVELLNTAWLFLRHRPETRPGFAHINLREAREITHIGTLFFLIQSLALVTFQTDTLVIARFLGAENVPSYSVTYSLFNYAMLPQALLYSYLWTAYNEAIARGDIAWVRRAYKLNVTIGVLGTAAVVGVLILICRPFINWWVGPAAVPSLDLAVTIGAWVIINAYTNPIACLFAAAAHLRNQLVYSTIATVCNLALSIFLVQRVGAVGVIGATVICYLIFICGPTYFDAQSLFRRLERDKAAAA